ncbi:MAG: hypothetical protein IPO62_14695 [Saprospiraceae bacterium]|nr:hypothetical protein [Saprospiraceae bacterium]
MTNFNALGKWNDVPDWVRPQFIVEFENSDCTNPGLVNGGFEAWGVPAEGIDFFGSSNGWTSNCGIEVWGNGYNGVSPHEGSNFIELNSIVLMNFIKMYVQFLEHPTLGQSPIVGGLLRKLHILKWALRQDP